MKLAILGLGAVSFVISWVATFAMIRVSPRIGFVDKPGHRKIHSNPKPLGGGVAIFWGTAIPLLASLLVVNFADVKLINRFIGHPDIVALVQGAQYQTKLSLGVIG